MPTVYGSFEQSFHIPPRYFMVKYSLHENFSEMKELHEAEHKGHVKRQLEDQKLLFKGCTLVPERETERKIGEMFFIFKGRDERDPYNFIIND
jgi:hypothetical protein